MSDPNIYMLDTNTFSYFADGRSLAARRLLKEAASRATIAVSSIVQGEILFGLARKPESVRLQEGAKEAFSNVQIVPWDSAAAIAYAALRLRMSTRGKSLTVIDTLIAAHALAVEATLVTSDKAFSQIDDLPVVNWATDL